MLRRTVIQECSVPIGNQSATAVGYVSMVTSSGDQEFHRRLEAVKELDVQMDIQC